MKEVTGAVHVAGCSGTAILTQQEEIGDGPGIAVMAVHSNTLCGYSFLFHDLSQRGPTIGHSIGELIRSFKKKSELLLLFPDPCPVQTKTLFNSIQEECKFLLPFIGGCASGKAGRKETCQFSDKDAAGESISGIYLTGEFVHEIRIVQACYPVSGPLIVTRARGNCVQELRGRPAVEHLSQLIEQPDPRKISEALDYVMIGLPVGSSSTGLETGNYVIHNITGIEPSDKSFFTTEEIREGQTLSFVVQDQTRALIEFEEMLDELTQSFAAHPPRFGLYFNSAGNRVSSSRPKDAEIQLIRKYLGEMPLIGFHTSSAIAPIHQINCLHTFSGILVLISDPME